MLGCDANRPAARQIPRPPHQPTVPKTPSSSPASAPHCDPRLPQAALDYRRKEALTGPAFLSALNVTAWLYRTAAGDTDVQVNPNVPIRDIVAQFGPAATPDAEIGFHSEFLAAEWFQERPELRVLQIFSERIPCRDRCAEFLRRHYPGVPWYYYYNRASFRGADGRLVARPAEVLASAYGL
jgi:hypothetical protein